MFEESKAQVKLGTHFPSAEQLEEFRRWGVVGNSFKGSLGWLDNPFVQQLQELQRTTQSWQNLMSPALAELAEINRRAAEASAEMSRIMEHQATLFQLGV